MSLINETHDPALKSWVEQANRPEADFPIQNLPFGRYRPIGTSEDLKIGVAIGDQILDLQATGLIDSPDMNALMALNRIADSQKDIDELVKLKPNDGSLLALRAIAEIRANQPELAMADVNRATFYDPVKYKRFMQRTTIGGDVMTVPQ